MTWHGPLCSKKGSMECWGKTNRVFNLACKGGSEFNTSQGGYSHIRAGFHFVALWVTFSSRSIRGALPPNHAGHFVIGAHPTEQNGVPVCWCKLKKEVWVHLTLGLEMVTIVIGFENVPTPSYGQMYKLSIENSILQGILYNVLIGQNSQRTCPDNEVGNLAWVKWWIPCKHRHCVILGVQLSIAQH